MLVDCAIAMPINDADISNEILEIGVPAVIGNAVEGMVVRKSGRTTGLTTGTIVDVNMTVNIGTFTWKDQIRVIGSDPICLGGDSGSVVVDGNNNLVGLLFAGPVNAPHNYYIANKMVNVSNLLNIGEAGVQAVASPVLPLLLMGIPFLIPLLQNQKLK